MRTIAEDLDLNVETVRNYFGGKNYVKGKSVGIHIEPGPDGGIVELDDTTILEYAQDILEGKKSVRITSYNVCYTKLLRFNQRHEDPNMEPTS